MPKRTPPPPISHEAPPPQHFKRPSTISLKVEIPRAGAERLKDDMKLAQWCERVLRTRLHSPGLTVALVVSEPADDFGYEEVRECTLVQFGSLVTHTGPCNGWPRETGCPISEPFSHPTTEKTSRER